MKWIEIVRRFNAQRRAEGIVALMAAAIVVDMDAEKEAAELVPIVVATDYGELLSGHGFSAVEITANIAEALAVAEEASEP